MPESQKAEPDAPPPKSRTKAHRLKSVTSPGVLSLKLPDEVARVVRQLAEDRGITATEVLRRGVALEKFVTEQLDSEAAFLIQRPDGSLERVHFVFT